jgi:hypothetical protein
MSCRGSSILSMTELRGIAHAERDGTRAETRFRLSPKRTSPFKSVGASVQSTAGSGGVRISGSNAGYTTFRVGVRVLATHSIRQFPLQFPSRASPCATRFRTSSNTLYVVQRLLTAKSVFPLQVGSGFIYRRISPIFAIEITV